MVFCLITAFSYYNRPIINPNEEYENMAQILQENNMHEGYATFWHANLLTEISNGSEEVWHCEIQNDQFMIQNVRPWLQKKNMDCGLRKENVSYYCPKKSVMNLPLQKNRKNPMCYISQISLYYMVLLIMRNWQNTYHSL